MPGKTPEFMKKMLSVPFSRVEKLSETVLNTAYDLKHSGEYPLVECDGKVALIGEVCVNSEICKKTVQALLDGSLVADGCNITIHPVLPYSKLKKVRHESMEGTLTDRRLLAANHLQKVLEKKFKDSKITVVEVNDEAVTTNQNIKGRISELDLNIPTTHIFVMNPREAERVFGDETTEQALGQLLGNGKVFNLEQRQRRTHIVNNWKDVTIQAA